jgi:hypothetical protein
MNVTEIITIMILYSCMPAAGRIKHGSLTVFYASWGCLPVAGIFSSYQSHEMNRLQTINIGVIRMQSHRLVKEMDVGRGRGQTENNDKR